MWYPAGRRARGGLFQHPVDLLEGEALGFRDEQISVNEAEEAERAPEEENLGSEVGFVRADEVRGDNGNDLDNWGSA